MSFTATVENDTIKLPPGVHLPDGTQVTVEPAQSPGGDTLYDVMKDFVGCIKDGPADLATEHDHYAHGTAKRSGQ